jgi:glutamyl-tRNA synthetase
MSKPVRVRFAPSPTGPLHIGGVRTALFNYLFAKKNKGVFFLRIEDTDQNRFVPGAEEYIMEALEWLGIAPDETIGKNEKFGPYKQSERKHLYKKYADVLINSGNAYYAFDTAEALDAHRKQHEEQGKTFIYNHHNREKLDTSLVISVEETTKRINSGEEFVIRFKTAVNETLVLQDVIRGEVKFETNLLDDKVLFKSDGMPTYHLANIVDDHLMETSHVIRGEEWLPSMPLHVMLYRSFGWEAPEFAHLPLIMKPIGNGKLSKRDGDKMGFPVFPLDWTDASSMTKSVGYREKGFFPEAVVNFLALLGWNDGTEQELFSLEELVEKFDLNRVHRAGAKFDPEKNKWFNHQYLVKQNDADLARAFAPIVAEKGITVSENVLVKIVSLIKERAHFVSEFWELSDYFFVAPTSYDEKASKNWKLETPTLMQELLSVLEGITDFSSTNIENIIKDWMSTNEIGMGKVMQPFRLSLVGALKGAHLFDIVELIGKEETIKRIEKSIASF